MNNWQVVEVLIALGGLFALIAKPIINNTKTIERLNVTMESLRDEIIELKDNNTSSHARMYKRIETNEKSIEDHEVRIKVVETSINK